MKKGVEFHAPNGAVPQVGIKKGWRSKIARELAINKYLFLMTIPIVFYYILFHYVPLYGAMIAFKQYDIGLGLWGSKWVGFDNFISFFKSIYFFRTLRNTLLLNFYMLVFEFPMPIIFALLLNELRNKKYKSLVQTVSYLPHFISMVVICGMIVDFCSREGIITKMLVVFGLPEANLLENPEYFRTIYVVSGIWQQVGWGSIIYLSALSGIDAQLYEAATIDGAGRFRKLTSITLPSLIPIIMTMFIMRIGQALTIGFEKIILLYNQSTYETADVISSFVYRKTFLEGSNYSYTTAVGLFNSTANFILLILANYGSKKLTDTSLW